MNPLPQSYYFIGSDSSVIEIVSDSVPDLSTTSWSAVSESTLHALGLTTPSEDEELAKEQDTWWEEESDGTWESWWFAVGYGPGNTKWVKSGASSARPWYSPGRTHAKSSLHQNSVFLTSSTCNYGFAYKAKAVTPPVRYSAGTTYYWTNRTEHWYGGPWLYHEISIYW